MKKIFKLKKNQNWEKKVSQYKLDPTLNWHLAEIISVSEDKLKFEIIDKNKKKNKGSLNYKNFKWSIPKKKLTKDIHKNMPNELDTFGKLESLTIFL